MPTYSEGGFSLPRFFADTQGRRLLDPGFIGGILIGAITAVAFWGLYNPEASFYDTRLEVRPIIGALLAGVGGGRVLGGLVERVITRTNLSRTQEAAERTASTMIGGEVNEQQQKAEVVVRLTQDQVAALRKIRALARQLKHAKTPRQALPITEEMEKVSRVLGRSSNGAPQTDNGSAEA